MDLRSKLELYKKNQESKVKQEPIPVPAPVGPDVQELLVGSVCSSEDGSFFLIEKKYPLNFLHGGFILGNALKMDLSPLLKVCREEKTQLRMEDLVFLDTETTGLAGGSGTVAFLIGTGFFTGDSYVLRQYFLRDYNEELPALKALNSLLSSRKGLVTFNGKSFDWNLLQTRFTFNRLRPAMKTPVHIDLLYPARMLWKLKLESCRLSSLEENILKMTREDDIPGSLIPSVYFKYLEDRNAAELQKVITHNEKDILSLVALMLRMYSILTDPLIQTEDSLELLGAANLFEKNKDSDNAVLCYNECTISDSLPVKEASLKKLAAIYRKDKDYKRAVEHLESILVCSQTPNIPVMIELAKHYEHRLKDIPKALEVVQKALKAASSTAFLRQLHLQDLRKRMDRLKKKCAN